MRTLIVTGTILALLLLTVSVGADENLADAIFKAEGGYKATYLYGIVSVPYKDEAEARQICINTINNNKKRFEKQTKYYERAK